MGALIIGGNGFLGGYLKRYVNGEILDRNCEECIKGDIRDPQLWDLVRTFDAVYYLAAIQYPKLKDPTLEAYEVNFKVPIELALRSKFFVYTSTWHVLGECKEGVTERAFYAMTKASADLSLRTLMRLREIAIVRPGTLIGKGMRLGGIASMVLSAIRNGVIKVFSSSVMRPMWLAHVDDVAKAISKIKEKGVYNLFLPYPYTVYEIAQIISEKTGARVKIVEANGGVPCARVYEKRESHLHSLIGKVRDVEEMLEEIIEWLKNS